MSEDGRSALVTFTVPERPGVSQAATTLQHAVAGVQARHPDLRIAESGDASISQAINASLNFGRAEATSVPITLVLLLVVFGALVAAGIPVLLALTALTAAIGVLTVASHWVPVASSTFEVVVIIGMAVGVDYSLFYLRREREERAAGRSPAEALRIAARTSGRAILISGLTVMAAMSGLFFVGGGPFTSMALGTIIVVGIAVVGSLTVLPGLLAWLGPRPTPAGSRSSAAARPPPGRPGCGRAGPPGGRPAAGVGRRRGHRPARAGRARLGLRLGEPAADVPKDAAVVRTFDAIEQAFPQAPAPAEVVVTGTDVTGPKVLAAVAALRAARRRGAARGASTAGDRHAVGGGRALIVDVPLAGDGANTASDNALATLRDQVLPATLGKVPGVSYAVTGDTAQLADDVHELHANLPLVFAVVAVLAFCLLLAAFRSVAVPLVSIALNLLSVGAAYGLVTLIFQDGRLQGPLDYTSFGGIIYWVPLLMFVFLFGISMDYHVFIMSRIRERWARGSSPRDAVVGGIASSAGTVTSAALIMVAVFSIFTTLPLIDLKILGVGTAAAVLIDATLIRGILLPAALALLGDRAWRLRPPRCRSGDRFRVSLSRGPIRMISPSPRAGLPPQRP